MLLRHTVVLAAIVAALAAVIGSGRGVAAPSAPRSRRGALWTVLLVLPVAIPDFVVGYAWHSFAPRLPPLLGATHRHDARHLSAGLPAGGRRPAAHRSRHGGGRAQPRRRAGRTFLRVTLPLMRTAVLGGCVLVGADGDLRVRRVRDPGLPDLHHRDLHRVPVRLAGRRRAGDAAGLPRSAGAAGRGPASPRRTVAGSAPRRAVRPARLRRWRAPGLLGAGGLVALGVGVPVGTIVYWMASGQHTHAAGDGQRGHGDVDDAGATARWAPWWRWCWRSRSRSISFRRSSVPRSVLERSTYVTKALPGVVDRSQPGVLRHPLRLRPV